MAITTKLSPKPLSVASSKLPAKIEALAAKQTVADIMQPTNPSPAITVVNPGKVANIKPIPKRFTVSVTNGGGAAATCFAFNMSTFKSNGGSVTLTVSDGFSGKLIDQLAADGEGLLIYGFNITGYASGGAKSDSVVNNSQLQLRSYDGNGDSYVPTHFNIAGAERNTQFKDGLFTIKTQFVLNCLEQLAMNLGAGEKIELVFFTEPLQD